MDVIECFLDRAHQILPDDGLVAMVLPAYAFQTPSRVFKRLDRFAIDVNMIPRALFPGLSKPQTWDKYTQSSNSRFSGLMLLAETWDTEKVRQTIDDASPRPGTRREAM